MKRYILFVFSLFVINTQGFGWGKTGHRVVGQIAENHMTEKAKRAVQELLGNESIAHAGYWMDRARSNDKYDYQTPWHYCTIPDSLTYEQAGTPEEGDAIVIIRQLVEDLKSKKFRYEDEPHAVRCLIHLVGDIHQPLHVGNGLDRGGNQVRLKYMYESSNLHRVWDTGLIDEQQLSFTEYVAWIDFPTDKQIVEWQNATVLDWANESKSYREKVYTMPEDKFLTYDYTEGNIDLVNLRLLQAGIRLAGIFNGVYE